jgi:hypothetical protein
MRVTKVEVVDAVVDEASAFGSASRDTVRLAVLSRMSLTLTMKLPVLKLVGTCPLRTKLFVSSVNHSGKSVDTDAKYDAEIRWPSTCICELRAGD